MGARSTLPHFAAKFFPAGARLSLGKRLCVAALGLLAVIAPNALESADANGDTRTIYLFHAHRKDSIAATFRVNGHYDRATLEKLNWFLRDWRNDEPTKMDPRLFDVLWEAYRSAGRMGPDDPVIVLSAYRCPQTNAMLRRRSRLVAEHSQHMLGKAMDTTIPSLSMEKLREIGMRMQRGGVGYYPSPGFVHLDVGGVRHWPRMSYDQLARLFPDGKTVHIPSNGKPLPGYEVALAEITARGGEAPTVEQANNGGIFGFFARLFGGGRDEEEDRQIESGPRSVRVASAEPMAPTEETASPAQRQLVASAEGNLPHGETYMGAADQPGPGRQAIMSQQPAPAAQPEAPEAPKPAAAAEDPSPLVDLPTPPRRPDDLVAEAEEAPLPPARPVEFAGLPAVITHGASAGASLGAAPKLRVAAPAALAYAAPMEVAVPTPPPRPAAQALRAAAAGKAEEQRAAKAVISQMTPARVDRAAVGALAAPVRQSHARPRGGAGFAPALRSAAKLDALVSDARVSGAPTGFKAKATHLSANTF
ncbi:MAG TPA: DUF882 domain-containing protein, partial [Rhodoblastus sp.]|nr:DUF882 domain-containing protein [Rhodoblastus sp.]